MKATGSFDDESGTDAVTHTLNNGNTGKVASGATLSTSTGNPSVTFGNGATSLTNSGTIVATGDRALDASKLSKGSSIAVTNNASRGKNSPAPIPLPARRAKITTPSRSATISRAAP